MKQPTRIPRKVRKYPVRFEHSVDYPESGWIIIEQDSVTQYGVDYGNHDGRLEDITTQYCTIQHFDNEEEWKQRFIELHKRKQNSSSNKHKVIRAYKISDPLEVEVTVTAKLKA
jgi:hypothetical protein